MNRGEVRGALKEILVEFLRLEGDEVHESSHLVEDLGADSLALVELGYRIAETFSIPIPEASDELLLFGKMAEHIHRARLADVVAAG